jgi:K+-sensing histidine kinase KdpD
MAQRVASESRALAGAWLARLKEILTVAANEVFASDQLLDHIPSLVEEIAAYLSAPTDNEIAANAAVMEKARELGVLRHTQHASVHQLLHEYEILGDILEVFLIDETERLGLQPSVAECFQVQHRLTHAIRVLMRTTVDTFVTEYTATIQSQTERIQAFNRAASHEMRSPIGTLVFAAALLDTDVVRQDPRRLAKVTATVRSSADRLTWLVENLQRIAHMGDTIDVPSQAAVRPNRWCTDQRLNRTRRPAKKKPRRSDISSEDPCFFLRDEKDRRAAGRNRNRVCDSLLCRGRASGRLECCQRWKIQFSDAMEGRCTPVRGAHDL